MRTKEVISIILIVLLFTSIVLTITNKLYGKDEDELVEEIREKNEAGGHWLDGVTRDEFVDADKESDLGYKALCEYNGGEWDNTDCKFDDDEKEETYEKKLKAYHGLTEEELQSDIEEGILRE